MAVESGMMLRAVLVLGMVCVGQSSANETKALRICRPPPPKTNGTTCLVVGDSVSLGYTPYLTSMLNDTCTVVHAPYSGDGGACDTRYGLQCANLWLAQTLGGKDTPNYSVVIFNFGLHDTNDSGKDEESRDEFVPVVEYGDNLVKFAAIIQSLQPQAAVGFVYSTPMHFDMHLNGNVIEYNAKAKAMLIDSDRVNHSLDLYDVVVAACGTPPYYGTKSAPNATHHCPLINDNEEYHYNTAGWTLLAKNVATFVKTMVKSTTTNNSNNNNNNNENNNNNNNIITSDPSSAQVSSEAVQESGVVCPDNKTSCPVGSTCVVDTWSDTKWGCCMTPNAVDCGDSWHCCAMSLKCVANGTYSHVCE